MVFASSEVRPSTSTAGSWCFQLALGHTLEHRAGLEDRSVYARVESDIICFGYRLLGGFGSRLLVCYACCGGFLICFGCGPLLIVRYVSCPAGPVSDWAVAG